MRDYIDELDELMKQVEYIDNSHSILIQDSYEGIYSFGTDHAKVYGSIGSYCIEEDIPCPDIIVNQDINYYKTYKMFYGIDEPKLKHICGIATKDRLLLSKPYYSSSKEMVPLLKSVLQKHKREDFTPSFDMRNVYYEAGYLAGVLNIPCPTIFSEEYKVRIARNNKNYIIMSKSVTEKEMQAAMLSHEMRHTWQHINAVEKMRRSKELEGLTVEQQLIKDAESWIEIDANAFEVIYMRDRYGIKEYILDYRFRDDEIKREAVFQRVKEIDDNEDLIIEPVFD